MGGQGSDGGGVKGEWRWRGGGGGGDGQRWMGRETAERILKRLNSI